MNDKTEKEFPPQLPGQSSDMPGWAEYWASLDKAAQDRLSVKGGDHARAWFAIGAVWGGRAAIQLPDAQPPLLAKQLSHEYNFSTQGDRDQAMRMCAEVNAEARSEVERLKGELAESRGELAEARTEIAMAEDTCRYNGKRRVEFQERAERSEASEKGMREALATSKVLIEAMETCHICKGFILVEEGPVRCEDCSSDCEEHDPPECPSIQSLHISAKKSAEAALASAQADRAIAVTSETLELSCGQNQ